MYTIYVYFERKRALKSMYVSAHGMYQELYIFSSLKTIR